MSGGRQLAAGGADGRAAVAADGRVDAENDEGLTEGADPVRPCSSDLVAGCRVEGNEIDMGPEGTGQGGELGGINGPIVDTVDQRPLERQAPAPGGQVLAASLRERGQRPAPVDGDQPVAELVVAGVERDRQVDRQGLGGQTADAGDQPYRGQGQVAGRNSKVVMQSGNGRPDPVV